MTDRLRIGGWSLAAAAALITGRGWVASAEARKRTLIGRTASGRVTVKSPTDREAA